MRERSETGSPLLSRRGLLGLLAAAPLLRSREARGNCNYRRWSPRVLLAEGATVPRDAALVLAFLPTGSTYPHAEPVAPRASLVRGSQRLGLRWERLAPDLGRLVPEQPPAPGRWTVEGLEGLTQLEFTAALAPVLAGPVCTSVWFRERAVAPPSPLAYGRSRAALLTVDASPSMHGELVAIRGSWALPSEPLVPCSAGRTFAADLTTPVYQPPPTCGEMLEGQRAPLAGMRARFEGVGRFGQLTAPTREVLLRDGPPVAV